MIVSTTVDAEEFAKELEADLPQIDPKYIRLCFRWEQQGPTTVMKVLASAVVNGRLLRMTWRAGSYFYASSEDAKLVADKAEKQAEILRQAAAKLGLGVRAGTFEEA